MAVSSSTVSTTEFRFDPALWVDGHADYLFRYAMFRLRDRAAAEDAVQETFLAAIQSYSKYEGRASERTWLVGILKHKIADHYRHISRLSDWQPGEDSAAAEYQPFRQTGVWAGHWLEDHAPTKWEFDAEARLEQKAFWETLERCLSCLPPRIAAAFTLREIDGYSTAEICQILNISAANLWVMLHRARLKVRSSLEAEWFRGELRNSGRHLNTPENSKEQQNSRPWSKLSDSE